MAIPVSFYTLSFVDWNKERSATSVAVATMTPANAAATITALGALKTALVGISLGREVEENIVYARNRLASPGSGASIESAQRESKYLLRYYDAVDFTQYTVEVPCAAHALLVSRSDSVDLTLSPLPAAWDALKTAFEAIVKSPNGNAVILTEAIFSGRNI